MTYNDRRMIKSANSNCVHAALPHHANHQVTGIRPAVRGYQNWCRIACLNPIVRWRLCCEDRVGAMEIKGQHDSNLAYALHAVSIVLRNVSMSSRDRGTNSVQLLVRYHQLTFHTRIAATQPKHVHTLWVLAP